MRELLLGIGLAAGVFLAYLGYNVLPYALVLGLFYFLSVAIGLKTESKQFLTVKPKGKSTAVTFDDVGGQASAKRELLEALDFIKNEAKLKALGIRPIKGILLTGPPGTGKTLLAKAAANYTDSAFISASGSEFIEVYAGVGAQRVRQLFDRARKAARDLGRRNAVVFIDELEVLAGIRGKQASHMEYDQTLDQLLVEMDGLSMDDSVRILVIGATNRIDLIDSALLRPGRFDRIVRVDLPDKEGRLQILKLHTRQKPLAPDVDLEKIAAQTFGFSGAHLESLANEAAIAAMREGLSAVHERHFLEAIEKVIMGEKLDKRPSREELERIAVHETGHAVVGEINRPKSVSSITVTPRGDALGYVRQAPDGDRFLYTRDMIESEIQVLLAGGLAEEEIFGNKSTGGVNDIERALDLARRIVYSGLSQIGLVDQEGTSKELIHNTVREIISTQESRVRTLIKRFAGFIKDVAMVLVEQERIAGEEFRSRLEAFLQMGTDLKQVVYHRPRYEFKKPVKPVRLGRRIGA